ncbi:hypothetical protein B0T11DRAFT_284700 [Plectosphaerella cucumerina]|uniref:Uncharacterized protein n=1 Tax=Plectosphaerella cucumerina TaxID=40658 RepID=A0A8K0TBI6_9PEZI|nr:hypothetical protein B0T11DRAFT_284700 [Plectosphaerella cucumerina]
MPSKAAASASIWQGAAPVARDGFAYGNGIFFADASGSRHARASVSELQEHFKSGNANDHPATWFEAQLLHYDLKPAKTKPVARMRLLDAVNSGLTIPNWISRLEADMKKEWTKLDRKAKKAAQAVPAATTKTTFETTSATNGYSTQTVRKEAKAESTPRAADVMAKRKALEPAASQGSPKRTKAEPTSSATYLRGLDLGMARRGGIHQGPGRVSVPQPLNDHSSPIPVSEGTARRSRPYHPQGRIPSLSRGQYDESEYGYAEKDAGEKYDTTPYVSYDSGGPLDPVRLQALGLLNGGYDIRSETVENEWPHLSHNLSLVFTLSGREMWGQFDLGVVEGIMHFKERPATSSYDRVPFTWRGRENEGHIIYGNNNHEWVQFLGDGRIEGELDG